MIVILEALTIAAILSLEIDMVTRYVEENYKENECNRKMNHKNK